jgi:serine/threonine protein kinase
MPKQPIPAETAKFFIGEIVSALERMHMANYFHRDIKPANILITDGYRLKLCDFGAAK